MTLRRISVKKLEGLGFTPSSTLQRGKALANRKPLAKRTRYTGPKQPARTLVRLRSGGICEFPWCGFVAAQIHHRRPRGMGGSKSADTNCPTNLIHICLGHHAHIESHREWAIAVGLLVPSGKDPATVLVLLRHSKLPVQLLPDGGYRTFERTCA